MEKILTHGYDTQSSIWTRAMSQKKTNCMKPSWVWKETPYGTIGTTKWIIIIDNVIFEYNSSSFDRLFEDNFVKHFAQSRGFMAGCRMDFETLSIFMIKILEEVI